MGAQKGSAFERRIAKRLSLWWTGGERDDVIWRTQASGARATQRSKAGKSTFGQHGDLQATDPIAQPLFDHCVIELKRGYGKWSLLDEIDARPGAAQQTVSKWLEQAEAARQKAGVKWALIIAKRDQRQPVIFIPRSMMRELSFVTGTRPRIVLRRAYETEDERHDRLCPYIIPLHVFLDKVTPEFFMVDWKHIGEE